MKEFSPRMDGLNFGLVRIVTPTGDLVEGGAALLGFLHLERTLPFCVDRLVYKKDHALCNMLDAS